MELVAGKTPGIAERTKTLKGLEAIMSEQKSTTPKLLLILIAALAVAVGVQAWYMAGMHKKLNQIQAGHPELPQNLGPGNSKNPASPAPLDDDWFKRPFDADKWDPFQEMQQMRDHIDNMFGDALGRFDRSPRFSQLLDSENFTPSVDLKEEDDQFVVHVDLPGAEKNNINVKLDDQTLTITGTMDQEQEDKSAQGKILRRERRTGQFSRTLTLPAPVNSKDMESHIDNGVLEITIPKK